MGTPARALPGARAVQAVEAMAGAVVAAVSPLARLLGTPAARGQQGGEGEGEVGPGPWAAGDAMGGGFGHDDMQDEQGEGQGAGEEVGTPARALLQGVGRATLAVGAVAGAAVGAVGARAGAGAGAIGAAMAASPLARLMMPGSGAGELGCCFGCYACLGTGSSSFTGSGSYMHAFHELLTLDSVPCATLVIQPRRRFQAVRWPATNRPGQVRALDKRGPEWRGEPGV